MTRTALVGGTVLTMDQNGTVLKDAAVVWEHDVIVYVGTQRDADLTNTEVIDCSDKLVLPGFVNAHTHASQTLLRGGPSHSRGLYDWLLNVVIPGLTAYSSDDLRTAIQLYCAEAVRSGVTTVVANEEPMSPDPQTDARLVLDEFTASGLRVRYALMFRDTVPSAVGHEPGVGSASDLPASQSLDAVLSLVRDLSVEYRSQTAGRVDVWPSPATTAVVSADGLRRSAETAKAAGGRWALHLAEIALEGQIREVSPVKYLSDIGVLDASLLAAHCVHIDDADIQLLASARVGVATNPVSNCYLGSGIAPYPEMVAAGMRPGLGTDDANCNDSINPLSDMKTLALIHRGLSRDADGVSPEQILRTATVDGAGALGLFDVGSLEVGKQADIQAIDLLQPQMAPMHDPYSALVFQAYGHEVELVVVAGTVLMADRVLTRRPDFAELCRVAQAASAGVLRRAGIAGTRASSR